jgi:hypothetical protein
MKAVFWPVFNFSKNDTSISNANLRVQKLPRSPGNGATLVLGGQPTNSTGATNRLMLAGARAF